MGVYTIETPDGRKLDIEADDEKAAIAGAQDWVRQNPAQKYSAAGEIAAPFGGFNEGIDATLSLPNTAANLLLRGVNRGAEALGFEAPISSEYIPQPFSLVSKANAGYEPQTTVGQYGRSIGQAAGASIAPELGLAGVAAMKTPQALRTAAPIIQRAAEVGLGGSMKAAVVPTIGAGVGMQGARDLDLGPVGELAGGVIGAMAAPAAYAPMARFGGGVKNAVRYGNEQVEAASNPREAAIQKTADSMVAARTPPSEIRSQLLSDAQGEPLLSEALRSRGTTEEHLADIISRRLQGESAEAIGADYDISAGTVNRYANLFTRDTPTPMNIPDIVTELRGPGGAMPVLRQGRAAFGIADDSADAGEALYNRQTEQSGRVANIIQQSGGRRGALDAEMDRLNGIAKQEERDAYTTVYQHAAPVDIDSVVRQARIDANGRAGKIGDKLNDAIDLFFQPLAQPRRISAMQDVRLQEMQDRIDAARNAETPNQARIDQLQRRYDAMRDDLEYEQNARPEIRRTDRPIQDVRRFVDARQDLDQMIRESMIDHAPTPLTQVLTDFRTSLNTAARRNNPSLASADARFYGNRSAERIIEQGYALSRNPTQGNREIARYFRELTPTQQELLRVAYEQKLADQALSVKDNAGAANQFSTGGFRNQVQEFYPAPARALRGDDRAAANAVSDRGQEMLRNLNREAITTGTGNFITGRGNSPTAVWANDIQAQMENARAAADLATGRFWKVVENLSNRLARQIGQRAASEQLRILTEMDRPRLLQLLNQLDRAAQGTAQRRAMVQQLRQLRQPSGTLNPPVFGGTVINTLNALAKPDAPQGQRPNRAAAQSPR